MKVRIVVFVACFHLVLASTTSNVTDEYDFTTRLANIERVLEAAVFGKNETAHKGITSVDLLNNLKQRKKQDSVVFSAYTTSDKSGISSYSIIRFAGVESNFGNHYNPSNGIFVTPVSGHYQFQWSIVYSSSPFVAQLVVQGSTKSTSYMTQGTSSGTSMVIVPVEARNHVWVQTGSGSKFYVRGGTYRSMFSGMFLYPL